MNNLGHHCWSWTWPLAFVFNKLHRKHLKNGGYSTKLTLSRNIFCRRQYMYIHIYVYRFPVASSASRTQDYVNVILILFHCVLSYLLEFVEQTSHAFPSRLSKNHLWVSAIGQWYHVCYWDGGRRSQWQVIDYLGKKKKNSVLTFNV